MNQHKETYDKLIEIIEKIERDEISEDSPELRYFFENLQILVNSSSHDVAAALTEKLEEKDFDPDTIAKWHFVIETFAGHVVLDSHRYSLILIPILASSAYGLPFGEIPEEIIKIVDHNLRVLMPSAVKAYVNPHFLTPEYFDYSGFELNQKLIHWIRLLQSGQTCFIESSETHEMANELVADNRIIAVIMKEPAQKPVFQLHNSKHFRDELLQALQKHYVATRFELPFALSEQMNEYLKEINPGEHYVQALFNTPIGSMNEAGKIFRHVALREALMNLKQTYGLTSDQLHATIAPFYINVEIGLLRLFEFRIGFSLKDKPDQIVQGITWPIFNEPADLVFKTLFTSLEYHGFKEGRNIDMLQNESFTMDEEEEEILYPCADGELHEPTEPDLESSIPASQSQSPYLLN